MITEYTHFELNQFLDGSSLTGEVSTAVGRMGLR